MLNSPEERSSPSRHGGQSWRHPSSRCFSSWDFHWKTSEVTWIHKVLANFLNINHIDVLCRKFHYDKYLVVKSLSKCFFYYYLQFHTELLYMHNIGKKVLLKNPILTKSDLPKSFFSFTHFLSDPWLRDWNVMD